MRTKLYLSALFALLAFVAVANSQTPAFTFQGRLTDGTLPASGTYEMQFSVHDAASGGAQIGTTVTNTSVNVANGVFSVVLDFSPATPFATGADRWLEIAVRKLPAPTFTTLTPRQQITSSPFSIRSLSSSGADSLSSLCVVCVTDAQIAAIDGSKVTGAVANAATAINVSGVVAVANGGTGSATGNASALTNITPANISAGTAPINITGIAANPLAVTSGATPSVLGRTMLTLNYATATTITDLTGGIEGQCVVLISLNSNASIPDSGNFKLANSTLTGVSGYPFYLDGTLTLCRSSVSGSPRWYETARSINTPIFDLNVTLAGNGLGAVTSNPAGISCASDCTEFYATGTLVTLTPSTSPTSQFVGWSGACTGTGSCVIPMTASANVTATFTIVRRTLTVSTAGTGLGTVTSSPAGIICGANGSDCSEDYVILSLVDLTATPLSGNTSPTIVWSGCDTIQAGNVCRVSMNSARSVIATFNIAFATISAINVDSLSGDFTFGVGASVSIQLRFQTTVTVTGTPQLALNSGGTANFASGSGTDILNFTYIVGALDNSPDLNYTSTSALTLNGGSMIFTDTIQAVNLTLPLTSSGNSLGGNRNIVINTATLSMTPASHNFGSVSTGTNSATQVFTVTNIGGSTSSTLLGGVALIGTNPTQFTITASTCNTTLPANGTCTITVRFNPTTTGAKSATLRADAFRGGVVSSSLTGVGI